MNNFFKENKSLFIVGTFIVLAISIRLKFHFSGNYILAGVDGPYYPLQVRSMMENFHLGLSDMPLLFVFEALIAGFLQFIHIGTQNECIIIAVKFVDVFLPPLAAIPVFLFAKELNVHIKKINFPTYLIVGYSILNVTPILLFSNNFQKNAVTVIFIFLYLYFVFRILKYSRRKDIYFAIITLLACTLTHFGSASILFLITGITLIVYINANRQLVYSINPKKILILISSIAFFILILFVFDSNRLDRFINLPIKVFESPVILMILDGQNIGQYFNPINFIVPNLLVVLGIILFIRIRKTIEKESQLLGLVFIITTIILSSPLIGIDWANRFYMMSYIPIVGLYLILFNKITKRRVLFFPVSVFSLIMCFAIVKGYTSPMLQNISNEAYQEFKEINSEVLINKNTAIVARQDLKILASWEFKTIGIANYLLSENDFLNFESVYYLIQKKGINYTQEESWRKIKIPINSIHVFQGNYFDLYKVENIDKSMCLVKGRSKIKGKIISLKPNRFILQNSITEKKKTIIISDHTQFHFSNSHNRLKIGMEVEIWGEGIPFSLDLKAETIVERI